MPALTPERTPDGWSHVASAYDDAVAPFLALYAEDALELAKVKPGERVLDVAAGSGAVSLLAAQRGAKVVATDFAPGMIARLRERSRALKLDVRAEVMDGQALSLEPSTFDAAFSDFGLIFFPDRAKGFREMHRVLKPGGRAVVASWSRPERLEWFALFGAAIKEVAPDLPPPPQPPAVFSLADPEAFAREMQAAGFQDVRIESVTHEWVMPSAEEGWRTMTTTNPVFPAMASQLGEAKMGLLEQAVLTRLAAAADEDGIVRLKGEAHLGVGTKPPA